MKLGPAPPLHLYLGSAFAVWRQTRTAHFFGPSSCFPEAKRPRHEETEAAAANERAGESAPQVQCGQGRQRDESHSTGSPCVALLCGSLEPILQRAGAT